MSQEKNDYVHICGDIHDLQAIVNTAQTWPEDLEFLTKLLHAGSLHDET